MISDHDTSFEKHRVGCFGREGGGDVTTLHEDVPGAH